MFDCSADVKAYHDDKVTLPQPERTNMRDRRNANRDRLRQGLAKKEKPAPARFVKQGSYAMLTMTQDSQRDYDIDDGVYFNKEDLKGPQDGDMFALEARQMVRDAVDDGRFKTPPEVRKNCVRVYYEEGYHVDLPVYRIALVGSQETYELASSSGWRESRAADVEAWFNETNQSMSPDEDNGRQFRRLVRMFKKFAKSRESWKGRITSGFIITKLAAEMYCPDAAREDVALRNTMRAIHDRLQSSLRVFHPVNPGEELTKGSDDCKTAYLRDRLGEALDNLAILDDANCTRDQALAAWDKVFNTDYFSNRPGGSKSKRSENAAALQAGLVARSSQPPAVEKRGGDRYA
jgi:hypothetical protein